MRKKLTIFLVLLLGISSLSFASDWRYVFGDVSQHPEILGGLLPTYTIMGAGYDGISLIEGNRTELQLLVGVGYSQRKIWQNPVDGSFITENPLIYDLFHTNSLVRFSQGFLQSSVPDKDLWTAYAGFEGSFEIYKDSMVVGKDRQNGTTTYTVSSIADWFTSYGVSPSDNAYYPDFGANGDAMLSTTLFAGIKLDMMDDQMVAQDGFESDFSLRIGPSFLNSLLAGTASFYSFTSNTIAAITLYSLKDEKDINMFSLVALDRFNINWTNGNAVPLYEQETVSLGRKVRGYSNWTFNTQFSVVNNFDLRISGPEPISDGLFPRVTLFFDVGFGAGNYFNTSLFETNFLASTGVQGTVSLFDFMDLGYQVAYLFTNNNYMWYGNRVVGSVTFFLDF
ncbi:hypothetical protein SpiGrapes_2463 [Sphaerochaeta pleomorpha str. Grapes]|uniref:DUF5723 domain-containing protein n=1 Tax=Sphaerochaeta pleomorpha (strain ATCC BAA-1885 / DSM 22778 / Grapes) TaxID=158190 RepID=G8QTI4_SPHPG|nr:hypothetical protein [Sphaerochaeta pleomorpha]AEV30225.1 hypothetical protein SpiGrapes_2463 [Sphaerochaeta pleomorpha str. Grapes]